MSAWKKQLGTLSRRYTTLLWRDKLSLVLLIFQAPVIGWFCAIAWGSIERDTDTLWFLLCLSAHWFGCIGACRELVKERSIFIRELRYGLGTAAYLLSKYWILALIGLIQVLSMQLVVESNLNLHGSAVIQFFILYGVLLSGVGLGLAVSAIAKTQERAVFSVPLLLLPQIVFSEIAIPRKYFGDTVDIVEDFMPVRWAFTAFQGSAQTEVDYTNIAIGLAVQGVIIGCLFCATLLFQSRWTRG